MMNKKGVLFDMDGTLINTYENVNYKQLLSELKSVQKTLILKIVKSRVKSYSEMEQKIREEMDDPEEAEVLIERVASFLVEHYANTTLKKDAIKFLAYLKKQNYKICLCTNNATNIVHHILQDKGIEEYFDYVITSQQVTKSKPDPQMYLAALANIQLSAQECIVFEDTESGVMAARNANLEVIVVCDKEKRKFADCPILIKDFSDERLYELF